MIDKRYRVLVEYDDGDSWDKGFEDAHEALAFYRKCVDARITVHDGGAVVKAQRLDGRGWTTVFKTKISRKEWF